MTSRRAAPVCRAAGRSMARLAAGALLVFLVALGLSGGAVMAQLSDASVAPEFPPGLQWLNVDKPLTLASLRGKVVLLDFWTYCCINCMHVVPDLKKLEAEFPDELVVIGVHSAKFTTEQQTDSIRQAILRYGIEHPVVNDADMAVWDLYGAHAWPSAVLIDPDGRIIYVHSGEGVYGAFRDVIAPMVQDFAARGKIDRTPLRLDLERSKEPQSLLRFPGKVLADESSGRLFIADSGHNRLVVVSISDGSLLAVIGSGRAGLKDGPFAETQFSNPQGMALDGENLYVADTDNHAVRRADLLRGTVATIAGTGQQDLGIGLALLGGGPRPARSTDLNSPWALALHGGTLYIAMAGAHQIWRLDLAEETVEVYAGSRGEGRTDGPLLLADLAQPSGLATDGERLYFADSESSSIRAADLDPRGNVETLVGGDLFIFGDRDGHGLSVRLQHPLGVTYLAGALYVADTYNNKVKRVRIGDRYCETFLGTGRAGVNDGEEPTFNQPGGVSAAGTRLYIADTNNHAIRVADLKSRRVETLAVRAGDLGALAPSAPAPAGAASVDLGLVRLAPGKAEVVLDVRLPGGTKLTAGAPQALTVESSNAEAVRSQSGASAKLSPDRLPIVLPVEAATGRAVLSLDLSLYYCREGAEGLCYFKRAKLRADVRVEEGAPARAELPYRVEQD